MSSSILFALLSSNAFANPFHFRTLLFSDLPADCDPIEARFGSCVETVSLFEPTQASPEQLENISLSYTSQWEDLTYLSNANLLPTIKNSLPLLEDHLAPYTLVLDDQNIYTMAPLGMVEDEQGRGVISKGELESFYPPLREFSQRPSEDLRRLQGRFVDGLGFDGHPHPFEIMDADREGSAPFYEQIYQFTPKLRDEKRNSPIQRLEHPIPLQIPPRAADANTDQILRQNIDREIATIKETYRLFVQDITNVLGRYASEDYTDNHINILAAVTLMEEPPIGILEDSSTANNIVAASLGQTDDQSTEIRSNILDDMRLNVEQLPTSVVQHWIEKLSTEIYPEEKLSPEIVDEIINIAELHIRSDAPPLPSLEDADLWLHVSLVPSADYRTEYKRLQHAHLMFLLQEMNNRSRQNDYYATDDFRILEIIINHFTYSLGQALQDSNSPLSPDDLASKTAEIWSSVLNKHGTYPQAIQQNTGKVNPTAICTTKDGSEALNEQSIKPITVDYILMGERSLLPEENTTPDSNLLSAYELLHEHKADLPFLFVNDPTKNTPEITHIINVPNDQAIYRIRWKLWSGWHLLWDIQSAQDTEQIQAKTAAFCGDMVFSPKSLVPTLLHASFLEDLLPTSPISPIYLSNLEKKNFSKKASALPEQELSITTFSDIRSIMLEPFQQGDAFNKSSPGMENTDEDNEAVVTSPVVIVLEVDDQSVQGIRKNNIQGTPYQSHQQNGIWVHAWTTQISSDDHELIVPKTEPSQSQYSRTPLPIYTREQNNILHLEAGFGQMAFTRLSTRTAERVQDDLELNEIVDTCIVGGESASCSDWSTIEFGLTRTSWLTVLPRNGFDLSIRTILDIYRPELSLEGLRPHVYMSAGWRWQPSPSPLIGNTNRLWGPNMTTRFTRYQYGVRGGLLIGDGVTSTLFQASDTEADLRETLVFEGWSSWSSKTSHRRIQSTPYAPKWLFGTYAQLHLGFDLINGNGETNFDGAAVLLGVRGSWKMDR